MTDIAPAVESPLPEKHSNPFSRIVGVLTSPSQTFAEIARRPDWVVPALVMVVISYISVFIMSKRVDFETVYREAFEAQHIPPQQQEQMLRWAVAFGRAIMYVSPLLAVGGVVVAAALLFLGLRLLGGQLTFLQAFAVTIYSWMPHVIAGIIALIVGMTRKSFTVEELQTLVHSNPAFLVHLKTQPMMFNFLSSLDVFSVWTIVLLVIGLSIASNLSKAKTAGVVIVLWAVFVLFKVGQGALAAMRMRSS